VPTDSEAVLVILESVGNDLMNACISPVMYLSVVDMLLQLICCVDIKLFIQTVWF